MIVVPTKTQPDGAGERAKELILASPELVMCELLDCISPVEILEQLASICLAAVDFALDEGDTSRAYRHQAAYAVMMDAARDLRPAWDVRWTRERYHEYLLSPEWKARRDERVKASGGRCQVCNRAEKLNVHHRTYERIGDELPDDLFVLCEECHHLFHQNGRLAEPPARDRPSAFMRNEGDFRLFGDVLHPAYGLGRIMEIIGHGPNRVGRVCFRIAGEKCFILAISTLKPVPESKPPHTPPEFGEGAF